ncbi:hypothetical protein SAMN06272783_2751 [Serratia sp. JKS296]|uniref:hypothetical protein n=1 Tax=Serratia sp. JKS296 TaxID=1938824 RepID=UPI000BCCC2D5|nr:hypothetical protein [Serratia sp. JKS296]SOD33751.1 hypothetical protein SAMN06272783_2751 [Serratia sp. JKS296]
MTNIKRFNPDYIMHAARFEPFAREAEHGEYVLFDAHQQVVSALKAERDALAVENAALKAAMHPEFIPDEVLVVFGDTAKYGYDSCDAGGWAWVENDDEVIKAVFGAMPKPETPATDAAVREIEAQGVEKFADFLDSPIDGQHCYQNEVGLARHFASTLREAK